jgi:hypothetical protein
MINTLNVQNLTEEEKADLNDLIFRFFNDLLSQEQFNNELKKMFVIIG